MKPSLTRCDFLANAGTAALAVTRFVFGSAPGDKPGNCPVCKCKPPCPSLVLFAFEIVLTTAMRFRFALRSQGT